MDKPQQLSILVVDADARVRETLADAMIAAGHSVATAGDGAQGLAMAGDQAYDVVVCDVRLPEVSGLELLGELRRSLPTPDVILTATEGSIAEAVTALKQGATDFLAKPVVVERLVHELQMIGARRTLQTELAAVRRQLPAERSPLIGSSPAIRQLLRRVEMMAPSDAPVLIRGESGTGKELVARLLHSRSARAARPFVAINCAAFPESLLEAELFGHEKGAFTGALRRRHGRFVKADGGTLFLDEVAELPLPAQAKLLRVLQEGAFEPLGSNDAVKVNVRIVSATHRDLAQRIDSGQFREDLFYRLKVLEARIPPLRERLTDVPALVDHFLTKYAADGRIRGLSPDAWGALTHYAYPGNVRELEHAVHHGVVLAERGEIGIAHLPTELVPTQVRPAPLGGELRPLAEATRAFERQYLLRALESTGGSRANTAALLGISRKNLWEKLRLHGIDYPTRARRPAHEHT